MSSAIVKKSIVHEGAVYPAGACIDLDADTAARLEKAGLVEPLSGAEKAPETEAPKPALSLTVKPAEPPASAPKAETCAQAESAAKKAAKKTAARRKKAAP